MTADGGGGKQNEASTKHKNRTNYQLNQKQWQQLEQKWRQIQKSKGRA